MWEDRLLLASSIHVGLLCIFQAVDRSYGAANFAGEAIGLLALAAAIMEVRADKFTPVDQTLKESSNIERHTTKILEKAGQAADLASESIGNLIGSKSYRLFFPTAMPQSGSFYLMVGVFGNHPVWDAQTVMADRYVDRSFFIEDPKLQTFQLRPIVKGHMDRLGPVIQGSKTSEKRLVFRPHREEL
jgi:hypothetical protein